MWDVGTFRVLFGLRFDLFSWVPFLSSRVATAAVHLTNLQGNRRHQSIPTSSHVVNGSNCRTHVLVEESGMDMRPLYRGKRS